MVLQPPSLPRAMGAGVTASLPLSLRRTRWRSATPKPRTQFSEDVLAVLTGGWRGLEASRCQEGRTPGKGMVMVALETSILETWVFAARIPEWVAKPSSRGSSQPRDVGLRPLVVLCVEPAGLCGRCPGTPCPRKTVKSTTVVTLASGRMVPACPACAW